MGLGFGPTNYSDGSRYFNGFVLILDIRVACTLRFYDVVIDSDDGLTWSLLSWSLTISDRVSSSLPATGKDPTYCKDTDIFHKLNNSFVFFIHIKT